MSSLFQILAGEMPWDRDACAKVIAASRSEGRFTPPSEQGTVEMPFSGGGTNWGWRRGR
jgi:quinoprotein glucose dehydrogenase